MIFENNGELVRLPTGVLELLSWKYLHQTVDESTWHFTHPFCASGPCERCLKQLVCKIHQIHHDWKIPRESFFFWPVFAMPKTDIRSCVAKTCRYMEFWLGVCRSCDRSRKSSLWWAWVFSFFLKYKLQKTQLTRVSCPELHKKSLNFCWVFAVLACFLKVQFEGQFKFQSLQFWTPLRNRLELDIELKAVWQRLDEATWIPGRRWRLVSCGDRVGELKWILVTNWLVCRSWSTLFLLDAFSNRFVAFLKQRFTGNTLIIFLQETFKFRLLPWICNQTSHPRSHVATNERRQNLLGLPEHVT